MTKYQDFAKEAKTKGLVITYRKILTDTTRYRSTREVFALETELGTFFSHPSKVPELILLSKRYGLEGYFLNLCAKRNFVKNSAVVWRPKDDTFDKDKDMTLNEWIKRRRYE